VREQTSSHHSRRLHKPVLGRPGDPGHLVLRKRRADLVVAHHIKRFVRSRLPAFDGVEDAEVVEDCVELLRELGKLALADTDVRKRSDVENFLL